MGKLDYDYFFLQLKAGLNIDDTCFYFSDGPEEIRHYLGYRPENEKPYWIRFGDSDGGAEFETAEELVAAKLFDGRSLTERWGEVRIVSIKGSYLDDWMKYLKHIKP